jgi:hypothetical protein
MNTSTLANEVSNELNVLAHTLRDLVDVEVLLIGGGDMPSNGY